MPTLRNVTEDGFDVSNIINDRRRLNLEWGNRPLWVVYKPGELTPANMAQVMQSRPRRKGGPDPETSATVQTVARVIEEWSLTQRVLVDGDGNVYEDPDLAPRGVAVEEQQRMYPVDAEHVARLSIFFLNHLMGAILDDQEPGEGMGSSFDYGGRGRG